MSDNARESSMGTELIKNVSFTVHNTFKTIIPLYDAFILDQFGVMHNGKNALPGATEAVDTIYSHDKKLIILSNSSAGSKDTIENLPKLGFKQDMFEGAITSGEEASKYILENYQGKRALWFTWDKNTTPSPLSFLQKCGNIKLAVSENDADFIIAHGTKNIWYNGGSLTSMEQLFDCKDFTSVDGILKKCADKNLPMVCANPDFTVIRPDGSRSFMPGVVGRRYEEFGGTCSYFGKPHASHFEACLKILSLDKSRVAHVGDSLQHDIAGANAAGIDSIFIVGGIHRKDLGVGLGTIPKEEKLHKLFDSTGEQPTHVVPLLRY